jgi:hypothetical protein
MSAQARLLLLDAATEQQTGAPDHIIAGLEFLAGLPPLWSASAEAWRLQLSPVRDFAHRWDRRARAVGWCDLTLYGVHRVAPGANFSALGCAWLAARSAYVVLSIDLDGAVVLGARTGSRLKAYQRVPDPDAMLPWLASPVAQR